MSNLIINGSIYNAVPEIDVPIQGGGTAKFYDTTDATAAQGNILATKTAYVNGGKVTGNMANNGDTSGVINTKSGTVSIPTGYTSGGTVKISSAEQAKIIAANIKSGVSILGQAGSSMVVDTTLGASAAAAATVVSGKQAFVNGVLITGEATMPTISQDSTTHILSIS